MGFILSAIQHTKHPIPAQPQPAHCQHNTQHPILLFLRVVVIPPSYPAIPFANPAPRLFVFPAASLSPPLFFPVLLLLSLSLSFVFAILLPSRLFTINSQRRHPPPLCHQLSRSYRTPTLKEGKAGIQQRRHHHLTAFTLFVVCRLSSAILVPRNKAERTLLPHTNYLHCRCSCQQLYSQSAPVKRLSFLSLADHLA